MNHTSGLIAWCGFSFIIPRELSWARYRGYPAETKKDIYYHSFSRFEVCHSQKLSKQT